MNPPELRRIQIEPTNRCNFRCAYCRRSHWSRPIGDLTLARFAQLLDRLPTVPHVHLQGVGEPLLNRDLAAMVRLVRERGMRAGTSTNGALLTRERAAALLDAGINRINLSLDTVDAEAFSRVRPGVPLATVLANLAALAEARHLGRYPECDVAIAVVAQQSTIAALPQVVALAARLGFDEVYVQNLNNDFLPDDYVAEELCVHSGLETYRAATHAAQVQADRLGLRFLAPALGRPDYDWQCSWPFHGCNITWDGFVAPCCLQPDPAVLNFGNLFATAFADIWASPAYERFRTAAEAGSAALCRDCPDRFGQMWHPRAAPFGSRRPAHDPPPGGEGG